MPRSAPNAHEGGPHAKITAWFEKCSPNFSHIRYMFVLENSFFEKVPQTRATTVFYIEKFELEVSHGGSRWVAVGRGG